jgi:hypothetical protein
LYINLNVFGSVFMLRPKVESKGLSVGMIFFSKLISNVPWGLSSSPLYTNRMHFIFWSNYLKNTKIDKKNIVKNFIFELLMFI